MNYMLLPRLGGHNSVKSKQVNKMLNFLVKVFLRENSVKNNGGGQLIFVSGAFYHFRLSN